MEAAKIQQRKAKKSKRKSSDSTSSRAAGLELGAEVKCTVLLAKNEAQCLVVRVHTANSNSANEPLTLGFVSTCDHNVQHGNIKRTFKLGQNISATVAKFPEASDASSEPSGSSRLLLTTSLQPQSGGVSSRREREELAVGTVVTGVVENVKPQHAEVKLTPKVNGYLSACDILDLKTAKVLLFKCTSVFHHNLLEEC